MGLSRILRAPQSPVPLAGPVVPVWLTTLALPSSRLLTAVNDHGWAVIVPGAGVTGCL